MYKVLVADDNKEITDLVGDILEKEGYELVKAYNGDEAIERFASDMSLVILDVMMPGKVLLARVDNLLKQRNLLKSVYQSSKEAEQEVEASKLDDRDKQFVKQLNTIIQQNLSNSEFGVEDIGKEIGLSRVQLYRKVKAMTGSSVVDLLRKARLAKAKRLLESRSMSTACMATSLSRV